MRRREFVTLLGGAAVTQPFAALAQPATMPVIGYLSGWSPGDAPEYLNYFRQGLAETGFTEGRNVAIEYRFAAGRLEEVAKLADDLVHRQVNVIAIPNTTQSAIIAKAATQTIPIVFSIGSNPVEVGLVQSLNHPGGNVTGLTALQTAVTAKRLELVHELIPGITKIAFLVNPANRALAESDAKEAQDSARALGINLLNLGASSQSEIDAAFAILIREQAGCLADQQRKPLYGTQRSTRNVDGPLSRARALCVSRECAGRWPYELRSELSQCRSRIGRLRRPRS